jgi:hypothetical protein
VGAVPNGPTTTLVNPVPFKGTATIGGKAKGKVIKDIDVTLSASAVASPPPGGSTSTNALADLVVRITGPNGATSGLVVGGAGTGSVGGSLISGLTLSDDTPTLTCGAATPETGAGGPPPPPPPPCGDPDATLLAPFSGTAQPTGALDVLDGGNAKGTYTLTAFDTCGAPAAGPGCFDSGTSTITSWSVRVATQTAPR